MEEFFNTIAANKYINFISLLIAISSIVVAFIFYKKSRKIIHVSARMAKTTVIDHKKNLFVKLKIQYDGEELSEFNTSDVQFNNFGNVSVKRGDVSPGSPLRITAIDDSKILEVREVYRKNGENLIEIVENNEGSFVVYFDFLNPREDFVLRVLHTGKIEISGVVIGQEKPLVRDKKGLAHSYRKFFYKLLKISVQPKFRFIGAFIDLCVSTALFANLYFNSLGPIWIFVNLVFAFFLLYTGLKRLFRKKSSLSSADRIKKVEGFLNSELQSIKGDVLGVLGDDN